MKRGVVVVSLVAMLAMLSGAASAAKPPDGWNHTHYFEFSELSLGTVTPDPAYTYPDCAWQGTKYILNVSPPDFLPFNCQNAAYVWAPVCKPGAQTAVFKKRIWLPGKASELQASLVSLGDKPLTMEIRVNNEVVLHTRTSVHKDGLRSSSDAFKYGWNDIEVRASKGKTGTCNQFSPDYGVYAHLHAKFGADLRMPKPTCCGSPGGAFAANLSVTNQGPSAATAATVTLSVYTQKLKLITDVPNRAFIVYLDHVLGEPAKCLYLQVSTHYHDKDYAGYSATCEIGALNPGETVNVVVVYKYLIPTGEFFDAWPIRWRADSTELQDPKQGNNTGTKMQFACRPAKPPLCKNGS